MTWPETEQYDPEEYKRKLRSVIRDNLSDPNAVAFSSQFKELYQNINGLTYEQTSIIGMVKLILRNSSLRRFKLDNSEFWVYGGIKNRKRMFSVLFNFRFVGDEWPEHQIYSEDVASALNQIQDINNQVT